MVMRKSSSHESFFKIEGIASIKESINTHRNLIPKTMTTQLENKKSLSENDIQTINFLPSKKQILKGIVKTKKKVKKSVSVENLISGAQVLTMSYDFSHEITHQPIKAILEVLLSLSTSTQEELPGRIAILILILSINR